MDPKRTFLVVAAELPANDCDLLPIQGHDVEFAKTCVPHPRDAFVLGEFRAAIGLNQQHVPIEVRKFISAVSQRMQRVMDTSAVQTDVGSASILISDVKGCLQAQRQFHQKQARTAGLLWTGRFRRNQH
jgi:hypothetical protein